MARSFADASSFSAAAAGASHRLAKANSTPTCCHLELILTVLMAFLLGGILQKNTPTGKDIHHSQLRFQGRRQRIVRKPADARPWRLVVPAIQFEPFPGIQLTVVAKDQKGSVLVDVSRDVLDDVRFGEQIIGQRRSAAQIEAYSRRFQATRGLPP